MIGKKPVRLQKATKGFIGNYIQSAIIWAALELHIVHGHAASKIDSQFRKELGQFYETRGPLEMAAFTISDLTHGRAKNLLALQSKQPADKSIVGGIRNAALRAALEIVAEGTASAQDVEHAFIHSLGRRYRETGPLESADMGGLDIFQSIFSTLGYLKEPTSISAHLARLVKSEQTGTKSDSKQGIYAWSPDEIAEVGGRRKTKLVELLHADQANHPLAGHNSRPGHDMRQDLIRHAALS